jgi:hypothetical protein
VSLEVSATVIMLAASVIFLLNGLGAHLAAKNQSPRSYFVMTSIVAYPVAAVILIYGQQVIP